jgi:hypothetical protein
MLRELLVDIASLVVVIVLPIGIKALFSYLGVRQDSNAALAINNAVERGASFVYQSLALKGISPVDRAAYDALIEQAANRVNSRVSTHTKRLGVDTLDIRDMIEDSFGKLMAADPNVSLPTKKDQ